MTEKNQSLSLKSKALVSSAIVFLNVVADQFVKLLAASYLRGKPGYSFLGGMLRIEYAENTGAFLSLGASLSQEARTWIFIFGVVVILAFCVYSLVRQAHNWWAVVALSCVIAGGVGNLIDRVIRGSVIDYLYMSAGPLHTGVFNVADMAISLGLVIMLWAQYGSDSEDAPKK
jgi:signal peptidase II